MFEKFGPVTSAVIMRDEKGESKGFGFVNFDDHEHAAKAVEGLNDTEVEGSRIYVGKAQKKGEREKELKDMFNKLQNERQSKFQVNLYVKNLDESVDDEKLRQEFAQCGTITSAKVMMDDKTGVSKGFGFVCYNTPEEATKAVTELNNKNLNGKPIYVALAQKKDQRKMNLDAQAQGQPQRGGPVYFPQAGFMYPGQPGARQAGGQNQGNGQRGGGKGNNRRGGNNGGNKQGSGYKLNNNVRNGASGQAKSNSALPIVPSLPAVPFTADEVSKMSHDEQRNNVGEQLFGMIGIILIANNVPDSSTGKITGMLLESMDPVDLVSLMQNKEALTKKVGEALAVLRNHQAADDAAAAAATAANPQ